MESEGHLATIQMARATAERTGRLAMSAWSDADLLAAQHVIALKALDKAIRDSMKYDTAETKGD